MASAASSFRLLASSSSIWSSPASEWSKRQRYEKKLAHCCAHDNRHHRAFWTDLSFGRHRTRAVVHEGQGQRPVDRRERHHCWFADHRPAFLRSEVFLLAPVGC